MLILEWPAANLEGVKCLLTISAETVISRTVTDTELKSEFHCSNLNSVLDAIIIFLHFQFTFAFIQ